jgi:hypothetical protein
MSNPPSGAAAPYKGIAEGESGDASAVDPSVSPAGVPLLDEHAAATVIDVAPNA